MRLKLAIIIPTYNEGRSIENTLLNIESEISKIKHHDIHILVVDDNSPDGTANVIKMLMKKRNNIHLLSGDKQGLGVAYSRGMKYAMKEMGADYVFEMDADGQHDPKYLAEFIKKIDEGYDYIIGSRYISGGSIPKEWGLHRKFLSFFGSFFARSVLGMNQIKDFTGGYKASRVKGFLDSIDLDHLLSKRHAYKIQLLYEMVKKGARTVEIPIQFKNRDKDFSKAATIEDFLESLKVVYKLKFGDRISGLTAQE